MEKNLANGSFLKSILLFSLPYLLSGFLQTLYWRTNLFINGQFDSATSTMAVSIGSQVRHRLMVRIADLQRGLRYPSQTLSESLISLSWTINRPSELSVYQAFIWLRNCFPILFSMGIAAAAGSLLSVAICIAAFRILRHYENIGLIDSGVLKNPKKFVSEISIPVKPAELG